MNQPVFDTKLPDALTRSQLRLAALAEMLPEAESLVEHPDTAHASRLALRTAEAVDDLATNLLKIHRSSHSNEGERAALLTQAIVPISEALSALSATSRVFVCLSNPDTHASTTDSQARETLRKTRLALHRAVDALERTAYRVENGGARVQVAFLRSALNASYNPAPPSPPAQVSPPHRRGGRR